MPWEHRISVRDVGFREHSSYENPIRSKRHSIPLDQCNLYVHCHRTTELDSIDSEMRGFTIPLSSLIFDDLAPTIGSPAHGKLPLRPRHLDWEKFLRKLASMLPGPIDYDTDRIAYRYVVPRHYDYLSRPPAYIDEITSLADDIASLHAHMESQLEKPDDFRMDVDVYCICLNDASRATSPEVAADNLRREHYQTPEREIHLPNPSRTARTDSDETLVDPQDQADKDADAEDGDPVEKTVGGGGGDVYRKWLLGLLLFSILLFHVSLLLSLLLFLLLRN